MTILGVFACFFVGGLFGVMIMALMVANGWYGEDDEMEEEKRECVITADEAEILVELIDMNLMNWIKNDREWDSIPALVDLMNAYQKLQACCKKEVPCISQDQ